MTGAVAPAPTDEHPERADLAAWLAVAAGTLGAFMATLDISIVNASLPTIQGEIGASSSEGTWISSGYLVAEIVFIPLTAWFVRMLGLRRFLLIAASLFTAFSVVCGMATDLTSMILGRVGQGLAGGTLIPTALTIIATRLPPSQQPVGIAIFGAAALLGPVMGPLVGGWITENFSWHYIFFINVPACAGMVLLLLIGLPASKGDWHEFRNADWIGVVGVSIGLGSLTLLLEEGHREQWFESALIWRLTMAAVIGALMVTWGQFHATRPVLRLSLLRNRALASTVSFMLVVGALLFGTAYILPQFLSAVAGYNAFQAGQLVFISGLSAACMMIVFPTLISRLDLRVIVGIGAVIVACSIFMITDLTAESVGSDFVMSQIWFGTGISMVTFSLQQAAINAVPPEDADESSALFVSARNLGGSIGLAGIASFQDQRLGVHHWQLQASLGSNDLAVQERVTELATRFGGGPEGLQAAYHALDGQVMVDALVMSFNDIFLMLAVGTLVVTPLIVFMRPLTPGGTTTVIH